MDVRIINPFILSVRSLFSTMLDSSVLIGKPTIKEKHFLPADVTAVIGFSGGATGSTALCFSRSAAVKIASRFAGADIDPGGPDLADALGELANIVAGGAKSKLEGCNINVSMPRVVSASDPTPIHPARKPVLLLPCDSALARFALEVSMILHKPLPPEQAPPPEPASTASPEPTSTPAPEPAAEQAPAPPSAAEPTPEPVAASS